MNSRLIAAARRERDTGKPPGAARALFRHIVDALKTRMWHDYLFTYAGNFRCGYGCS